MSESIDRIQLEELRGCLANDYPLWALDVDLIVGYVKQALLGQSSEVKDKVIDAAEVTPDGLVADMELLPFQTDLDHPEPYLQVLWRGSPLVNISLSRLTPNITA